MRVWLICVVILDGWTRLFVGDEGFAVWITTRVAGVADLCGNPWLIDALARLR